jgi:hypothetical protein
MPAPALAVPLATSIAVGPPEILPASAKVRLVALAGRSTLALLAFSVAAAPAATAAAAVELLAIGPEFGLGRLLCRLAAEEALEP